MWRWAALFVLLLALSAADAASAKVAKPRFVRHIATGETGWFSSPGLVDLNGDGKLEIVAPVLLDVRLRRATGGCSARAPRRKGRVYAPERRRRPRRRRHAGDRRRRQRRDRGGLRPRAAARLQLKPGWPASTCSGGQCPETRGMAAADLDGDGRVEVVATTTNTSDDRLAGLRLRRAVRPRTRRAGRATARRRATPTSTASATTATAPTARTSGSATSTTTRSSRSSSPSTTTRSTSSTTTARRCSRRRGTRTAQSAHVGARLGWGQFIRWLSPTVEDDHYHRHVGAVARRRARRRGCSGPPRRRRSPTSTATARNEVIGLPNVEQKEPYETQAYAFMVLDGAQNGGARSARRHRGFDAPAAEPQAGGAAGRRLVPAERHPGADGRQHRAATAGRRSSPPCPTAPSTRSARPAGGCGATTTPTARRRRSRRRSSPPTSTATAGPSSSSAPTARRPRSGRLVVLSARGQASCYDVRLRHQGRDGNGIGVAGGAVDRRPRRRRAPGDRAHDVRPRHRRLPRAALGRELPALADRARQPAAQRRAEPPDHFHPQIFYSVPAPERRRPAGAGLRVDVGADRVSQPQPVLLPQLEHV